MRRGQRLGIAAAIVFVLVVGVVYWQWMQFSRGLESVPTDTGREILLSAWSAEVLAPDVDTGAKQPRRIVALADQFLEDPDLVHWRYLLVTTWLHATQLVNILSVGHLPEDKMISSDSLTAVPAASRVDGWRAPYCVLVEAKQMVVISSGGRGPLDCSGLLLDAQRAGLSVHDPRLTRSGNVLVTVQPRLESGRIEPR